MKMSCFPICCLKNKREIKKEISITCRVEKQRNKNNSKKLSKITKEIRKKLQRRKWYGKMDVNNKTIRNYIV